MTDKEKETKPEPKTDFDVAKFIKTVEAGKAKLDEEIQRQKEAGKGIKERLVFASQYLGDVVRQLEQVQVDKA